MEGGDAELHTTELTALSAAESTSNHNNGNNVDINMMEVRHATDSSIHSDTSIVDLLMTTESTHVMEAEITTTKTSLSSTTPFHSNESVDLVQQQQQQPLEQLKRQQHQPFVRLPPFFKAASPVGNFENQAPLGDQQQQQHPYQPLQQHRHHLQLQPRPPFFAANAGPSPSYAASSPAAAVADVPATSFTSTYSLFPSNAASSSSLDFTAAWVASTPFSAAAATAPFATVSVSPPSGFVVNGSGAGNGVIGGGRPLHFVTPKVVSTAPATMSTTAIKSSSSSSSSSSSLVFGKPRQASAINATTLLGQQQQHQQAVPKFYRQANIINNNVPNVCGGTNFGEQQQRNFGYTASSSSTAPFVTPHFVASAPISSSSVVGAGIFDFPKDNDADDGDGSGVVAASVAPPFFVPSVGVAGETTYDRAQFKYPLYNRNLATNHLGRHWKQMGCHTRQYLQPSIPLPTASTRMASAAAKQFRGASLGGPPGSLSPLTANKSWAQVVASSTPQQSKSNQQQQTVVEKITVDTNNSNNNAHQQHPQQSNNAGYIIKASTMPPPSAPSQPASTSVASFATGAGVVGLAGIGVGAMTKPTRSNSLRGLAGLGAATSSNRDFKCLLLRLKTALDKEKEKWRPIGGGGGGGAATAGSTSTTTKSMTSTSNPSDEEIIVTFFQTPEKPATTSTAMPLISGQQRDECIFWLAWILRKFRFSAETMSLAVSLFDAVLLAASPNATSSASSLVVTKDNCRLVALVCLLLAAKFSEEDADVPTTKDLIAISEISVDGAGVAAKNNGNITDAAERSHDTGTTSNVVSVETALRTERLILMTLDWDLNRPTPLKFLEILHTLLMCHQPQLLEDVALGLTPAKHLERLTWKMQRIVANHQLVLRYRPAVLAVALLSVDLESIGVSDWQLVSATLEKICQVGSASSGGSGTASGSEDRHKLTKCKNLIVRVLAGDRGSGNGGSGSVKISQQSSAKKKSSDKNIDGGDNITTMMATAACRSGAGRSGNGGSGLRSTDDFEKKRSMTKLKRKHVPSEPGVGGGGGGGDAATLDLNAASSTNLAEIAAAGNSATFSTPNRSSSATSSTSSSKSTLKRVFNIAESPTCKSEARSVDDDVIAASRFQPLQGLIF